MKYLTILFLCACGLTACSSLVEDLNENPNAPTTTSYQYILTGAELGNTGLQTGETARKAGIFCGYYTGIDRQHQGFSEYAVTTSDFDAQWNDAMVGAIANTLAAEQQAQAEGINGVTTGITQVIRAAALGTTTALWGDIPFDDVGQIDVINPAFEGQLMVYDKLQSLLDEAIINLSSGAGRPVSGADIHFDGNPAPWTEVAYTLKARYFMHTRDYAAAYTAAQQGISAAGNSWLTPHGNAANDANLNYQFFAIAVRQSDLITSEFMTSLVAPDATLSPDFSSYRGNAKTDETGRYNYLFNVTEFGTQPNVVDGFAATDEPSSLLTYQENLLLLAEAGFRTAGFETGLGHLNDFRAFMAAGGYLSGADAGAVRYDAYGSEDFVNGGMENADGLSEGDALLREILEERYITFFGQIEGFNDTRRTENELMVRVPVMPNMGSDLPQRFLYPTTEIDRNSSVPSPLPNFFDPTAVNR
ncbi:MAG: hypothetical protein ACI81P_002989 [Neolewinella sp.]|jgi:hypothetical protein